MTSTKQRQRPKHDNERYGPDLICPHCGYNEFSIHRTKVYNSERDRAGLEPKYETVAVCARCNCFTVAEYLKAEYNYENKVAMAAGFGGIQRRWRMVIIHWCEECDIEYPDLNEDGKQTIYEETRYNNTQYYDSNPPPCTSPSTFNWHCPKHPTAYVETGGKVIQEQENFFEDKWYSVENEGDLEDE